MNAYSIISGEDQDKLAETQAGILENFKKRAISEKIKANIISGDPTSGSIIVNRFANSKLQKAGTARTAGKGNALDNSGKTTVLIDDRLEIMEEVSYDDIKLRGLPTLVEERKTNHLSTILVGMEKKFFDVAEKAGSEVVVSGIADIEGKIEAVFQDVESTSNPYVEGVEREIMSATLSPKAYGAIRTKLDKIVGADGEEFYAYHGVKVFSNVRQTKDIIVMVDGSVAQPYYITPYDSNRIPLSNDYSIESFLTRGTKAIAPDLIKWATV